MSIVDSRPELKRMSRLEGGIPRSGASGRTDAGESADVQPLRRPDTDRRGGRPAPGPRLRLRAVDKAMGQVQSLME